MSKPKNQISQADEKSSAMSIMAERYNVDPKALYKNLKETCFKGANDAEMMTLIVVANEYGLNPLTRQIYAFPAKGGGITPVVSVDGWMNMMNHHPNFNGIEFTENDSAEGKPISVTATLHLKNANHPVIVTEYFEECFRPTEPWRQMPRRMLRHKAVAQVVRVGFGFSGIYDQDEATDISRNKGRQSKPLVVEEPEMPAPVVDIEPVTEPELAEVE